MELTTLGGQFFIPPLDFFQRKKSGTRISLAGTRCYLGGNLEHTDAKPWRPILKNRLTSIGVSCLSPTETMFEGQQAETPEFRAELLKNRELGNLQLVHESMRPIIQRDLRAIDLCDFCIFRIETDKPTWGTVHEIVVANQQKKPIFIAAGDKGKIPLWLLGLLKPSYFYDDIEEVVAKLFAINVGKVLVDSGRWRILKDEFRKGQKEESICGFCQDTFYPDWETDLSLDMPWEPEEPEGIFLNVGGDFR